MVNQQPGRSCLLFLSALLVAACASLPTPSTQASRVSTLPVDSPVVEAAPDTQVQKPAKAPLPNIAYIKIGSHVPGALLYVDDQLHSSLSGKRLQWLAITPGRRRIRVVVEGCAAFETTVTLSAGDSLPPLNYKDPICDSR